MIEIAASPSRSAAVAGLPAAMPNPPIGSDGIETAAFGALLAAQPGMESAGPAVATAPAQPAAVISVALPTALAATPVPAILPPTGKILPEPAAELPAIAALALRPAAQHPAKAAPKGATKEAPATTAEPAAKNAEIAEVPPPEAPGSGPAPIVAALIQPTVITARPAVPQAATAPIGTAPAASTRVPLATKQAQAPRPTVADQTDTSPQRDASRPATSAAPVQPGVVAAIIEREVTPETTPGPIKPASVPVLVAPAPAPAQAAISGADRPVATHAASAPASRDAAAPQAAAITAPMTDNVQPALATIVPVHTDAAPATPSAATPVRERIDFATLVDSIARARDDAAATGPVSVAVRHSEFGKVSLQFNARDSDGSGHLSVAMASADPGFAPAVAIASEAAAMNADPGTQRSDAQPQQQQRASGTPSQDTAGDARGQNGGRDPGRQEQHRPGREAEAQRQPRRGAPDEPASAGIFA